LTAHLTTWAGSSPDPSISCHTDATRFHWSHNLYISETKYNTPANAAPARTAQVQTGTCPALLAKAAYHYKSTEHTTTVASHYRQAPPADDSCQKALMFARLLNCSYVTQNTSCHGPSRAHVGTNLHMIEQMCSRNTGGAGRQPVKLGAVSSMGPTTA
jgi:hypothetical protein